jgi:ATP-binding cassette subfamily B protein
VLSRRIKEIQKVIVAETTALAGATTESLRNIELVKSLGLADQEVRTTELELLRAVAECLELPLPPIRVPQPAG